MILVSIAETTYDSAHCQKGEDKEITLSDNTVLGDYTWATLKHKQYDDLGVSDETLVDGINSWAYFKRLNDDEKKKFVVSTKSFLPSCFLDRTCSSPNRWKLTKS